MNKSYFEILRPGINTTIQDKGRYNLYHIGVSVSGAIDQRNYKLANATKKDIHILHITTAEEIELLNKNKKFISYEVTPQHLTLSSPSCYNKLGSLAQMNPAIRSNKHLNRLRKALKNNEIDIVGSDHAPHTLAEKKQEYPDSPSGMPGVQTLMPILLNEVSKKNISINNVVQLTSYNPIKRFKVKNKGEIRRSMSFNFIQKIV